MGACDEHQPVLVVELLCDVLPKSEPRPGMRRRTHHASTHVAARPSKERCRTGRWLGASRAPAIAARGLQGCEEALWRLLGAENVARREAHPRGLMPHPVRSSGSLQTRSHTGPCDGDGGSNWLRALRACAEEAARGGPQGVGAGQRAEARRWQHGGARKGNDQVISGDTGASAPRAEPPGTGLFWPHRLACLWTAKAPLQGAQTPHPVSWLKAQAPQASARGG